MYLSLCRLNRVVNHVVMTRTVRHAFWEQISSGNFSSPLLSIFRTRAQYRISLLGTVPFSILEKEKRSFEIKMLIGLLHIAPNSSSVQISSSIRWRNDWQRAGLAPAVTGRGFIDIFLVSYWLIWIWLLFFSVQ